MEAFPNAFFTDSIGAVRDRLPGHRAAGRGATSAPTARWSRSGPRQRRARRGQPRPRPGHRRRQGRPARPRRATCRSATTRTRRSRRATFIEIDGVRYSVPGDFARIETDGNGDAARPRLQLHQHRRREGLPRGGRDGASRRTPASTTCSWSACPTSSYGQAVAAVVQPREGADRRRWRTCASFLRAQLSGYKLPRARHARRRDPAQRHRQGAVPAGQGAGAGRAGRASNGATA